MHATPVSLSAGARRPRSSATRPRHEPHFDVRLALGAFVALLAAVVLRAFGLDQPLFLLLNGALHAGAGEWPDRLWSALSVLGLGLSAALLVALRVRPAEPATLRALAALIWCVPLAGVLTQVTKRMFDVPRPAGLLAPELLHVIGAPLLHHATPSGHAITVFSCLAIVLGCARRLAWPARAACVVAALLLGLARVATAAHWPADVCLGATLGLLAGALSLRLADVGGLARWLGRSRGQGLVVLLQLGGGVALLLIDTGYPLAQPLQWALGAGSVAGGLWRLWGWRASSDRAQPHLPASLRTDAP